MKAVSHAIHISKKTLTPSPMPLLLPVTTATGMAWMAQPRFDSVRRCPT